MNSAAGGLLASDFKYLIENINTGHLLPGPATVAQVNSPVIQKHVFLFQSSESQFSLVSLKRTSQKPLFNRRIISEVDIVHQPCNTVDTFRKISRTPDNIVEVEFLSN
jgi:hypothetical protein